MPNDSLAAHTPTQDYTTAAMRRRALELIGAKGELLNTLAPLPYKSEYPFSPKVMDAVLTMTLDPIVKPLSLQKGQLDRIPVLKKLSKELADRGYFQKYPGGGVGIGGGGGSAGDDAGPGPGPGAGATQPGADPADFTLPGITVTAPPAGDPHATSDPGAPNAETLGTTGRQNLGDLSSIDLGAAGRGILGGGWGSFMSAAASAIATLAGIGGFGLGGAAIGTGINAAIGETNAAAARGGLSFSDASQAIASARGATGVGGPQGGGAQGSPGGGDPGSDASSASAPSSGPASIGAKNISPSTRANAAARVGGGIAPDFLSVLQSLQG